LLQGGGIRVGAYPLATLFIDLSDCAAQGAAFAGRLAELLGQLGQQVVAREVAACAGDLVAEDFRV
jgi:hypothetical protein